MAWTTPRTWATGELVTAALMNTHVRDNLKHYADTRYMSIPLNTAFFDAGEMSGFLASATIVAAIDNGLGGSLSYIPYQKITFPDSGSTGVAFTFHVPHDYGGTPVLKYQFISEGTVTAVKSIKMFAVIGAVNVTGQEAQPVNIAAVETNSNSGTIGIVDTTTAGKFLIPDSMPLTNDGGLTAGALAGLYLIRVPSDAGDTFGADVSLVDLWLEYSPLIP